MSWLLLLHQIPPQPPYFRAKVLRRLTQLGALPIKNSAYLLPENDDTTEDFEWVRREISEQGGDAWLFRSEILSGLTNDSIRESFRALRSPDYVSLIAAAGALQKQVRSITDPDANHETEWRKLKRRFEEIRRIDFFGAPEFEEAEKVMNEIDRKLHAKTTNPIARPLPTKIKGRVWVTRRGVKVDRIASAWFIRRFVDPAAKFLFVDPASYIPQPDHLRFDMFEGEFTHENDMCTFEVLVRWSGLNDAGLAGVAEVVHDIDLKDGRYQRNEAAGIRPLIEGIALRLADDMKRIEEGSAIFESLYARFRRGL